MRFGLEPRITRITRITETMMANTRSLNPCNLCNQWFSSERRVANPELEDVIDGLVTAAYWSFGGMTVDSSRDRWAYGTPGGLRIVPVAPTVTCGGQTIYFETINTAQVGLNPDEGPSPR